MMKLKRLLAFLIALGIMVFAVLQTIIIIYPSHAVPEKSDAVIIPGYALIDGTYPDPWLEARLIKGAELYREGYAPKIIVSGGQGQKDKIPVAEAMKTWLVRNNIPSKDIYTEDSSHSTYENMKFCFRICQKYNLRKVIIETNDFHLFRSMLTARGFFNDFTCAGSDLPFSFKKVICYIKEPVAIVRYVLLRQ